MIGQPRGSPWYSAVAPADAAIPRIRASARAGSARNCWQTSKPDFFGIVKEFQPTGERYALAVRLSGPVKTAFPAGQPAESDQDKAAREKAEKERAAREAAAGLLREHLYVERIGRSFVMTLGYSDHNPQRAAAVARAAPGTAWACTSSSG